MWTTSKLKEEAKRTLKQFGYWMPFFVTFIAGLIAGGSSGVSGYSTSLNITEDNIQSFADSGEIRFFFERIGEALRSFFSNPVVATTTMRFGAVLVFFFVMVLFNLLSSTSCTQLMKTKGELERELARLEDSRMREATRWEEMKTTESIESALLRHGLSMRTPSPAQTVRLMANGVPRPGQLSLTRSKMRTGVPAASYRKPKTSYRRTRSAR